MNELKILIIGNFPPPYGGVPHHIERLTDHLRRNNWKCHVLAGGMSGITKRNNITIYKPKLGSKLLSILGCLFNINILKNLYSSGLNIKNLRQVLRYAAYYKIGEEIIEKEGIKVIATYNLYANSPIGHWLANKYNIPHAINIFGEIYKNEKHFLENSVFFNKVIDSSDLVISCSSHCGNSLKLINNTKIINVIPYGIDLKHFNYGMCKQPVNDKVIILFVGRQCSENGGGCVYSPGNRT